MTPFDIVLFLMGIEGMMVEWYENENTWTFHYTFTKNEVIWNYSTAVDFSTITDDRVTADKIMQKDLLNYLQHHFKIYRFFDKIDFTDYEFPKQPIKS
jgi:hypothetical protein